MIKLILTATRKIPAATVVCHHVMFFHFYLSSNLVPDVIPLLVQMGTSETASAVHWKARKILEDTTALVTPDL